MPDGYISKGAVAWFIALAVLVDIIVLLIDLTAVGAIVTPVISVIAWLTFYLLFKRRGVHFNSPKRVLSMGGGFLIELLPIINILPGWTVAVILVIGTTKLPAHLGGTGGRKPRSQDEDADDSEDAPEDVEE